MVAAPDGVPGRGPWTSHSKDSTHEKGGRSPAHDGGESQPQLWASTRPCRLIPCHTVLRICRVPHPGNATTRTPSVGAPLPGPRGRGRPQVTLTDKELQGSGYR